MENPVNKRSGVKGNHQPILNFRIMKDEILKLSEINKTRLEFLKEEIISGRYQISSQTIAARLLADFGY